MIKAVLMKEKAMAELGLVVLLHAREKAALNLKTRSHWVVIK
jgi:hypothetical protein